MLGLQPSAGQLLGRLLEGGAGARIAGGPFPAAGPPGSATMLPPPTAGHCRASRRISISVEQSAGGHSTHRHRSFSRDVRGPTASRLRQFTSFGIK